MTGSCPAYEEPGGKVSHCRQSHPKQREEERSILDTAFGPASHFLPGLLFISLEAHWGWKLGNVVCRDQPPAQSWEREANGYSSQQIGNYHIQVRVHLPWGKVIYCIHKNRHLGYMISDTEDIFLISRYCQIEPCKCKYFFHISFYINSEQDQNVKS